MNKDPESWSRVRADAVMAGSKAQRINVMQMALDDIRALSAGVTTVTPPELLDALQVMLMAWDAHTTQDALRLIGLGSDVSFPGMLHHSDVSSVADARAVYARYRPHAAE